MNCWTDWCHTRRTLFLWSNMICHFVDFVVFLFTFLAQSPSNGHFYMQSQVVFYLFALHFTKLPHFCYCQLSLSARQSIGISLTTLFPCFSLSHWHTSHLIFSREEVHNQCGQQDLNELLLALLHKVPNWIVPSFYDHLFCCASVHLLSRFDVFAAHELSTHNYRLSFVNVIFLYFVVWAIHRLFPTLLFHLFAFYFGIFISALRKRSFLKTFSSKITAICAYFSLTLLIIKQLRPSVSSRRPLVNRELTLTFTICCVYLFLFNSL